ncbi:hypothetical protein PoB_005084300 [Plakobranchus ocellatus]|uniref:Transposase n=1 Tax=Plakobranchus ocellatus TaxID=259542 RepID=A0AAV4BXH0_9GAST|nr:hypothetical protein PoB_005084300 [Plakobranchus ocellatus]
MSPLLVENAKKLERLGLNFASPLWKNNNCESLNQCLKQALSWRSLKPVELVQKLHSIIKTQHREVLRAICGVGKFVLVDEYQKFGVPKDVWYFYSGKQQRRHMKKFANTTKECLIRSTNSEKVVVEPKHKGKKQGQRKRKVCNGTLISRTATIYSLEIRYDFKANRTVFFDHYLQATCSVFADFSYTVAWELSSGASRYSIPPNDPRIQTTVGIRLMLLLEAESNMLEELFTSENYDWM